MKPETVNVTGWERVALAIEEVRNRLRRATQALESGGIPYAVAGGNAVAEWVGSIDKAAMRFTQDVDIVLRREDLEPAKTAMSAAGFVFRHVSGIDMFLDGPGTKARDAVHVIFSGERVRPEYVASVPDVSESKKGTTGQVLSLEALVRMKLTSFRFKDRVHVQDMIGVGLIDASWLSRFQPELAARLKELLDNPGS